MGVMAEPVGFLITWTCYGTWLYGDERGSVDDEHNAYGTAYLPPDKRRIAGLRRRMRRPPFRLTKEARELITNTIEEHCRRRGWELPAVSARSNHVHVVVGFAGVAPEMMMGEWKAWSSRRLRERGLAAPGQPVWTRHGSTRYVWKKSDLDPAVAYVVDGQDATRFRAP
jgi:REP element-mobilizing transposase RayT